MLTKLTVRNFKRFESVEIELGNPVVFVGPNNCGKSTALQALALWSVGLNRWKEKRTGEEAPTKRPGVTINRRDLTAVPVPVAKFLWRDNHVRAVQRREGAQTTSNIRIDLIVEGVSINGPWKCGFEFDYANDESFYCRPLRVSAGEREDGARMSVPQEALQVRTAYLPPMSGLAVNETLLQPGAINVRIGEGRTAEVLRNLCYQVAADEAAWAALAKTIQSQFGVSLEQPRYIAERGEIELLYRERDVLLDISCCGRGLQQVLLLTAYLLTNKGSVLLLDEPDAHLEVLRQRQIYRTLTETARAHNNQLIIASHSEVVLNEAAERDVVVAFVGTPRRINDRGSQLRKALTDIGFEDFWQAEASGWGLYLEGSTDLAILQALAARLMHANAVAALERPFVKYVGNQPAKARDHFHAMRNAYPRFTGVAVFDRLDVEAHSDEMLIIHHWTRREIENYFCYRETLEAYAIADGEEAAGIELLTDAERNRRLQAMRESIEDVSQAMETLGKGSPWSADSKVSDDFLDPLFKVYEKKLGLAGMMAKKNFHVLAAHVPLKLIDPEVGQVLDLISRVAAARQDGAA